MFGSHKKPQPSVARYSPLSGNSYNHSRQNSVDEDISPNVHPEVEKADGDESSPSFKSRLFFALLGTLVAALVVGAIIDALGLTNASRPEVQEGTPSMIDVKQFAPPIPKTTVVFSKEAGLMDPPNDENRKSWNALIPIGRGFVNISDAETYGLRPGIPTASGVDRYAVAMFHQLHCLAAVRDGYGRLMDAMSEDWTDAARQEERSSQLRAKHTQHCFAYLAESIWCSGDLTIEWARVEKGGGRRQVDGWGIPHQCKDPDAIRAWVHANHGPINEDPVHLHDRKEAPD